MVETGEKFGKYTLLDRLAVGGMAEIFKARVRDRQGVERIVAIKRLHRHHSEDDEFVTMLRDEARLAVRLEHPNIGEVFDLGEIDGQYFIVMEYIDGLNVDELVDRVQSRGDRLPAWVVVETARGTAAALHYAHTLRGADGTSMEVVHRDVSPQNIMLDVDGGVKLVDFGIAKAKARAQHTRAGVIKGKLYYMSPEQGHGSNVDARTDVYALGMVLYELLAGKHPFESVDEGDLLRHVRTGDFVPFSQAMPDAASELASIVDRALERDKNRRFQSADELRQALDDFAGAASRSANTGELAKFVRRYGSDGEPRQHPPRDLMGSDKFRASNHSVIFEAESEGDDDEFEEGGPTQVFVRESDVAADDRGPSAQPEASPVEPSPRDEEEETPVSASETTNRTETKAQIHHRLWRQFQHRYRRLSRRGRLAVGAGFVVAVAGMAAIIVWGIAGVGGEEAAVDDGPQPGVVSADGDVIAVPVSTRPEGADVIVDGEFRGETPTELGELEVGRRYDVAFERPGYYSEQIELSTEEEMIPRVLRLNPRRGRLRVVSVPEEADVEVDGEFVGQTPVTMMGLDRKLTYRVDVDYGDEATEGRDVAWREGDEVTKTLEFEFGDVEEDEDETEDDGEDEDARRRARTARAPSGGAPARHRSPAPEADDGPEEDEDLDIWEMGGGQQQGRLNVRTDLDDGRIYVDGDVVTDGADLVGHSLEPGSYEVKAYSSSTDDYTEARTVEIRPGETSTIRIRE